MAEWRRRRKETSQATETKWTSFWVEAGGKQLFEGERAERTKSESSPGRIRSTSSSVTSALSLSLGKRSLTHIVAAAAPAGWPTTKSDGPSVWPATKVSFSRWNSLVRRGHRQIAVVSLCARGLYTYTHTHTHSVHACVCVHACAL